MFHFIAYVPINGKLYELDGLQPAPIAHGACDQETFPSRVVEVLQRRIARYGDSEIRFNLMAVCRDLRVRAREFGDVELLEREQRKREAWQFENALRGHNFVGFTGEVLKEVVTGVLKSGGEEAYKGWVQDGMKRKNAEDRLRREQMGGGGDTEMGG